jgi:hypothetical protein
MRNGQEEAEKCLSVPVATSIRDCRQPFDNLTRHADPLVAETTRHT